MDGAINENFEENKISCFTVDTKGLKSSKQKFILPDGLYKEFYEENIFQYCWHFLKIFNNSPNVVGTFSK